MSNQKTRTVKDRINDAVEKGLDAFWEEIFKEFDEVGGDDPERRTLEYYGKEEVKKWLLMAAPEYNFETNFYL